MRQLQQGSMKGGVRDLQDQQVVSVLQRDVVLQ